jgi:hypothetical protein
VKAAFVIGIAVLSGSVPRPAGAQWVADEEYSFLTVVDGQCLPTRLTPAQEAECDRLTEPRRFRGTWQVEFEGSVFTPVGKSACVEGVTRDLCPDLTLEGKSLPWPSRWACPRRFEVEFIGRRSVHPRMRFVFDYRVVVERLISAKRLPDPPFDPDNCDPNAP